MALATSFVYEPLSVGQIRILQLAPAGKDDVLRGRLVVSNIDEPSISYDALSYMWGDPTPTSTIRLLGKPLPLTGNLTVALQHIRSGYKWLNLWVDAICINQKNLVERAEQVRMMRRVFQQASVVRIWIYEPYINAGTKAIQALQQFSSVLDYESDNCRAVGDQPDFWDSIAPLFVNDYWTRAWVQQEVLNASHISLQCMDVVISGVSLLKFQRAIRARYSLHQSMANAKAYEWTRHLRPFALHHVPAADGLFMNPSLRATWYLSDLLTRYESLMMSDPRDRVYSLMHLAIDYDEGGIEVNYEKTVRDVAIDVAIYHVNRHRDLRFLHDADAGRNKARDSGAGVPTWIPSSWLGYVPDFHPWARRSIPRSSPYTKKTLSPLPAITQANRQLRIRGVCIAWVMFEHEHCVYSHIKGNMEDLRTSELGRFFPTLINSDSERTYEMLDILSRVSTRSIYSYSQTYQRLVATSDHSPMHARIGHTSHQPIRSALTAFLEVAGRTPDEQLFIGYDVRLNEAAFALCDVASQATLSVLLRGLSQSAIIETESRNYGITPTNSVMTGDEIWMVLGCAVPIVVRRHIPGETYQFVCAAEIPRLQEHPDLEHLTSDSQPGDKVGEWTVEDILLE
ncbi:heterokaryon incompatibility protein-domain-containing protein [Paraphoma chrysanthemicola]|nr:heterokaryon incompatibility protein-domain-containing protein [Paraphoma chrysanthemicola]